MKREPVTKEVFKDLELLEQKSVVRFMLQYHLQRQRLNINKSAVWPMAYSITSPLKNKWIVFIQKDPLQAYYNTIADAKFSCVVYYYATNGLLALRQLSDKSGLEVFNGHVFHRYNDRLKLGLTDTLSMLKHFFNHNGFTTITIEQKDKEINTFAICKDGMLLGTLLEKPFWYIHRTFISKDLKQPFQQKKERQMLSLLYQQICSNQNSLDYKSDHNIMMSRQVYAQITSRSTGFILR